MKFWLPIISSAFILVLMSWHIDTPTKEMEGMPFYSQADFTPEWISPTDKTYTSIHTIDKFRFLNQDEEWVTNNSLNGQIYVANFFFTVCPSICPKMTDNMALVMDEFREDHGVRFLSHTVMPWVDSVAVLKQYAVDRGIDSEQWHFVTGDADDIYELARSSYFAEKEIGLTRDQDEFLHTENFILVDGYGRIRGVYNGTLELEMRRLIIDITTLKAEV